MEDPFDDLAGLQRTAELLHRFARGAVAMTAYSRGWIPRADVYVQEHEAVVVFELPGVDPGSLLVEIDPRRGLRLAGSRPRVAPHDLGPGTSCLAVEIPAGAFQRLVPLPFAVDATDASADYHDGLLTVRLRQAEQPSDPIKIPLKGGKRR